MNDGQAPPAPHASEPLLAPDTYAVFARVPPYWWDEAEAVEAIATILHQTCGSVRRRLSWLITSQLVERRKMPPSGPLTEIRRVGK